MRCSKLYSSIDPWPADKTKRSRSNHLGLDGLCLRKRVHKTYAKAAAPIGRPGCPLLAFWTASIDKKRSVLIDRLSRSTGDEVLEIVFTHFCSPYMLSCYRLSFSNRALMATITVLAAISAAPTAGLSSTPQAYSAPAASGMAMTL